MAAHQLADVTVVADAGMMPEANKKALEAAGAVYGSVGRMPDGVHGVDSSWREDHPDTEIAGEAS